MSLALTDLLSPDVPVEGELRVSLPLADMTRVSDMLLEPPGHVDAELCVRRRDDGLVLVEGRIDGVVRLACQRCLDAVEIPVARDIRLVVVGDDEAATTATGFETWSAEDGQVTVRALLEDELLLALPLVPVHEDPASCGDLAKRVAEMAAEDDEASRDSPFAVLEQLKR